MEAQNGSGINRNLVKIKANRKGSAVTTRDVKVFSLWGYAKFVSTIRFDFAFQVTQSYFVCSALRRGMCLLKKEVDRFPSSQL